MSVKRNTPNEMFMGPTRPARPNGWTATGVLFVALVIAIWASVTIIDAPNWMILLLEAAVILIAVVAILKRSYLGIAFIVGSLPILALLPDIPFATSIFPLVGGVTLISYVVQQRWGIRPGTTAKVGPPLANAILVLSVIFVAWSISSNPVAAMVEGDRNWAFTLIQLLAILWLASTLFIDKRVHQAVFLSFAATAVLSAIVAILTVTNPSLDNRAVGLAGGANSAARYFVIALIFLNYFRESTNRPPFQLLIMAGMIILLMGLLLTLSRTGLILAILSFLLILFKPNPVANRRRLRIGLFLILISLWLVPDQVFTDLAPRIFSSISEGSDTVGLRYQLWEASWRMWLDHPITGVGIGQFPDTLQYYAAEVGLTGRHIDLGVHNLYLEVLSETGMVGIALYLSAIGVSIWSLLQASRDPEKTDIAWTWLVALASLLIGGLTKHDLPEKLIWISMGVAISFAQWQQRPTLEANKPRPAIRS